MSTTIDSLEIQIRSTSGSAAANIDRLADSLRRLRESAKLTAVANNLTKLSTALASLQASSTALSNLRGLAGAMKSLSAVQKSAGLNSILNSLNRLPAIIGALDPATVATFAARLRELAAGLAPLAKELDRVGTSFSRLPAKIQQMVTATNRLNQNLDETQAELSELNTRNINFAAFVTGFQAIMGAMQGVRDQLTAMISDAIEWDGIQFRFGRAFGEDADMVYDYVQKVTDALYINEQQFMQYSSLYGSLLSGFGMAQEKVTTISIGLTELSYDIWAAYNDRYKTLEDASEAVRSAITGEIEPIRNAGIALTEASMQEYLDSLGLAHIRMANLSEAQKAQVRYAVMVNSAMNQGIVGTYAREMVTAEGAVRTLSQQMKTLGQAIGSIFIPILSAVIPWISAFVQVLYDAIAAVAAFFNIPFFEIAWGDSTKGLSGGLGDVADAADNASSAIGGAGAAAKKLKDYTMGFDELNIIDPDSASSGGGGGGGGAATGGESDWEGLDLDTLWNDSVLAEATQKIDELKQKILDWFGTWKTEIAIISGALAALTIAGLLTRLGEALSLGNSFLGVMGAIKKLAASAIIITLEFALVKSAFSDFMSDEGSLWDYVKALLIGGGASWVLYSMWGPAGLVIGFSVIAMASLSAVIDNGGIDSAESASVAITGIAAALGAIGIAWKKTGLKRIVGELGAFIALLREGNRLTSVFAAAFPKLANAIGPVLGNIGAFIALLREGNSLFSVLAAAFPKISSIIGPFFGNIAAFFSLLREGNSLWSVLAAAFPKLSTAISTAWSAISTFVGGLTASTVAAAVGIIAMIVSVVIFLVRNWEKLIEVAKRFFQENIVPKLEAFRDAWENLKESLVPIKELFLGIGENLGKLVKQIQEKLAPLIEKIQEKLGPLIEKIRNKIGPWIEKAREKLAELKETITEFFADLDFKKILSGIGKVFEVLGGIIFAIGTGPMAGLLSAIASFLQGIARFVDGTISILSGLVSFVVALFQGDWAQAWESVKEIGRGILTVFEGMYHSTIGVIVEFVMGVIDWFVMLWDELVGHSIVPDMIDAIVEWFLSLPGKVWDSVEEFTEEIVSIFKEMWSDIKSWWNTNVAPKFTKAYWTDKFDTIRSGISAKLDEAKRAVTDKWTEIKSWYNTNIAPKFTKAYWTDKFDTIRSAITTKLDEAKRAVSNKWAEIKSWYNTNIAPKFTKAYWTTKFAGLKDGLIQAIRNGINGAVEKINSFISWLNNHLAISLPAVTVAGKKVFEGASFQVVTIPSIPRFEQGGVLEDGLFTMNRGEIAGKFTNGTSVVANNQMIVEGIAAGVYQAVVAAMNDANTGGGQNVNVYLDGKQIYASVKKTETERGRNLMGNQLGYSY